MTAPLLPRTAAAPPPDRFAQRLRGFGPIGVLAILIILAGNLLVAPLGAILVLLWARRSATPWHEIGYVRPKSWPVTIAIATALGIVLKLVMKAVVMPLLGAPPINPTYHFLVGNSAALPGFLLLILVRAGFGEETLFRGYLFERLGKLFGDGVAAKVAIVLLTSALFGLAHYPEQGLAGVEQATIVGLVFGSIYARTGQLFPLMIAHAAFDFAAVAIIYWDLESAVAHWIFQ